MNRFVLLTLAIFLLATPSWATDYYVCDDGATCNVTGSGWSTGSDSNAGTSRGAPWKTIGKAASTLVAGDTVIIGNSDYGNVTVTEATNGSSGSEIIYQADTGATVQLARFILNGDYIQLKNLTFERTGSNDWNPSITFNGDYGLAYQCTIYDYKQAVTIGSGADNITIQENTLYSNGIYIKSSGGGNDSIVIIDNEFYSPDPDTYNNADGIFLVPTYSNWTITGNYFHDWTQGGTTVHADLIQFGAGACGLGNCNNVIIEYNYFDIRPEMKDGNNTISAVMFRDSGASSSSNYITGFTFRYNIFRGQLAIRSPGYATNSNIYGNLFISDLDYNAGYWGVGVQLGSNNSNWYVHNNITTDFPFRHYEIAGLGHDVGNNYAWNSDSSNPQNVGATPTETDPKFVNYTDSQSAPGDYTLAADSPCINTGATVTEVGDANEDDGIDPANHAVTDWPGVTNLDRDTYGDGWEIGAYVYETGDNPPQAPSGLVVIP